MALLWRRQKSILDLWLTVAVVVLVAELWVTTFVIGTRYSLGFYASRLLSLTVSVVILIVLLTETTVLYARLSNVIGLLQRERANRLMNVQAATAAMAHEMRQPLGAIVSYGAAGSKWLKRTPPNLEEVGDCLSSMVGASYRAEEIIARIRELFKQAPSQRTIIQINDITREVLRLAKHDLQVDDISVITEFQRKSSANTCRSYTDTASNLELSQKRY